MSDVENIKSPCQSICILQEDEMSNIDYCIGCFRTVDEIQEWYNLSDYERVAITNALPHREEKLK